MIVDAHCHLDFGDNALKKLIKTMDSLGVNKAVVCPTERYIAVYNHLGNRYIVNAVRKFPKRLFGFATVNPWFGKKAEKELKISLQSGLKGLKLNPFLQGFILNDEIVHPLIELCEEFEVPVYFHTGTPVSAMPFQLAYLAREFPNVQFIMGHMGYSDFWYDAVPAAEKATNIILETSHIWTDIILEAYRRIGSDRIVFGTDAPISDPEIELKKIISMRIREDEKEKILGGNIIRVME